MEQFGINITQLIAYTIIFVVIYFFARGFLNKAINNLEERKKIIEDGLKNAELAQKLKGEKLQEADAEKKEILNKAFEEAREIVENAKSRSKEIIDEANERNEINKMHFQKELSELREESRNAGLSEAKEIIAAAIRKSLSDFEPTKEQEEKYIKSSLDKIK